VGSAAIGLNGAVRLDYDLNRGLGLEWMRHKEIEFTVDPAAERDDVWVWRFTIGGEVRAGKTVAKLKLLAIRRVQSIIDRELRKRNLPPQRG
jgi:hypothetical protein